MAEVPPDGWRQMRQITRWRKIAATMLEPRRCALCDEECHASAAGASTFADEANTIEIRVCPSCEPLLDLH